MHSKVNLIFKYIKREENT